MPAESITARIRSYLIEHFPSARRQPLGEDQHLLANGVLDSLGVLDVVGYLEGEFGITVSDEDLLPEHFGTLRRLAQFVEAKQGGGATS